ncbi:arylsulfatase B-like isoform X3 [Branchiostoma lanceolatum]|uniref:arylsulfatase B-like isoform X3 n=1 Tax=Branchiostoma lanceolatum TaxID=7740 RepID=UPI0034538D5A
MAVDSKGALLLLLITAVLYDGSSSSKATQPPHIILIVADDLGWNDVSFHGSDQIPTPNLDSLAYSGVILGNYYVSPICTPTRSAIMTGRHPIHTGLQHGVIIGAQPYGLGLNETVLPQYLKQLGYATRMVGKVSTLTRILQMDPMIFNIDGVTIVFIGLQHFVIVSAQPYGLALNETILPQYMKQLGYTTRMVGKWHLGMYAWDYTPTYRGFDSFYGYYTGAEGYVDHVNGIHASLGYKGLDLRNGTEPVWTENGTYSTELFATEAERIIASHDTSKPLFLYLPHQAVHSGNPDNPLQAPQKYIDKFPHIQHPGRRTFAAMVSALDDAVGNVTKALSARGMLENSVIIFTTDNGGPAAGFDMNYASNWPLRGVKNTLWEGGVHGTGFVHSPLIKQPKRTTHELLHVCDLLPTIYTLAGGDSTELKNLDGTNVWETISRGVESPRVEVLHNIDPKRKTAALRYSDYKIILGEAYKGAWDGWYPPEGVTTNRSKETNHVPRWSGPLKIKCGEKPANASTNCKPRDNPCVFNIKEDPCEFNNIADWNQPLLTFLMGRLEAYSATAVPIRNQPTDPRGNPKYHGGVWSPWINLTDTSVSTNELFGSLQ